MGGSILGAKSIHSFLKTKIKKEVFFFDNLDPNLNYEYKKIEQNVSKISNNFFGETYIASF